MAAGRWEDKDKEEDVVEWTEMDRCFLEVLTGRAVVWCQLLSV